MKGEVAVLDKAKNSSAAFSSRSSLLDHQTLNERPIYAVAAVGTAWPAVQINHDCTPRAYNTPLGIKKSGWHCVPQVPAGTNDFVQGLDGLG